MSTSESGVSDDAVVSHQGVRGTFVLAGVSGANEWIEIDADSTVDVQEQR